MIQQGLNDKKGPRPGLYWISTWVNTQREDGKSSLLWLCDLVN